MKRSSAEVSRRGDGASRIRIRGGIRIRGRVREWIGVGTWHRLRGGLRSRASGGDGARSRLWCGLRVWRRQRDGAGSWDGVGIGLGCMRQDW